MSYQNEWLLFEAEKMSLMKLSTENRQRNYCSIVQLQVEI